MIMMFDMLDISPHSCHVDVVWGLALTGMAAYVCIFVGVVTLIQHSLQLWFDRRPIISFHGGGLASSVIGDEG